MGVARRFNGGKGRKQIFLAPQAVAQRSDLSTLCAAPTALVFSSMLTQRLSLQRAKARLGSHWLIGFINHFERPTGMAFLIADSILAPRRANPKAETISEMISSSVRSFPSETIHLTSSSNSRVL